MEEKQIRTRIRELAKLYLVLFFYSLISISKLRTEKKEKQVVGKVG